MFDSMLNRYTATRRGEKMSSNEVSEIVALVTQLEKTLAHESQRAYRYAIVDLEMTIAENIQHAIQLSLDGKQHESLQILLSMSQALSNHVSQLMNREDN